MTISDKNPPVSYEMIIKNSPAGVRCHIQTLEFHACMCLMEFHYHCCSRYRYCRKPVNYRHGNHHFKTEKLINLIGNIAVFTLVLESFTTEELWKQCHWLVNKPVKYSPGYQMRIDLSSQGKERKRPDHCVNFFQSIYHTRWWRTRKATTGIKRQADMMVKAWSEWTESSILLYQNRFHHRDLKSNRTPFFMHQDCHKLSFVEYA